MTAQPVAWGIVGTGPISAVMAKQANGARNLKLAAVCSRTQEKADAFAREHQISRSFSSVGDMLADHSIDAVYIGVPHAKHLETILQCLDAGKHVLCEKPMGLNAAEVHRIAAHPRANEVRIGEGFMLRHQPQWRWIEEQITAGALGDVRAVHAFTALTVPPTPHDPTRGHLPGDGSLMLDIACYSVHLARTIFASEPSQVSAAIEFDEGSRRDILIQALMRFPAGWASLTVAANLRRARRVHILGTEGNIEVFTPVHSPDTTTRVLAALKGDDGEPGEFLFPAVDQYGLQLEEFSDAIRYGRQPLVPLDNALGNAKALDAISRSAAERSAWVAVGDQARSSAGDDRRLASPDNRNPRGPAR